MNAFQKHQRSSHTGPRVPPDSPCGPLAGKSLTSDNHFLRAAWNGAKWSQGSIISAVSGEFQLKNSRLRLSAGDYERCRI